MLIVVSRVRGKASGVATRMGLDPLDRGYTLKFVVGVLGDVGRRDDLRLFINGSLAVVGLHEGGASWEHGSAED